MTEEKEMHTTKQGPPQFILKLKGKKVIIRLVSGGQPVTQRARKELQKIMFWQIYFSQYVI